MSGKRRVDLIEIMGNFEGAFHRNAKIASLLRCQFGQLDTEIAQVGGGNFLLHLEGEI